MIRPRKIFIIVMVFGFWMLATYIFVTNKSQQNELRRKSVLKQIEDLESDVRDRVEERKYLKEQIMSILKTKIVVSTSSTVKPSTESAEAAAVAARLPSSTEAAQTPPPNPLDAISTLYLDDEQKIPVIPVLVFACNRPSVTQCLDNLIKYRPNREMFPIIVSQVLFSCGAF